MSEILSITYLQDAASWAWTSAEPEFRLSWMKLCSSDNHYTIALLVTCLIASSELFCLIISASFLVSSGFNLMTCDSYFTNLVEVLRNHILAENTCFTNCIEWTENKAMVLKQANKCQIVWCHDYKNILISNFHHHPFPDWTKVL